MSCDVRVIVVGPSTMSAHDALDRIDRLESRWSRFLPDSELSRLNSAGGRTFRVSDDTRRLVVALVEAWHVTNGAFDPTLLVPLVSLGYAASRDDARLRTSLAPTSTVRGRPDLILVDAVNSTVALPPGTVLDPGGLGKGLAADVVVDELISSGARGALVSIGGDLRVAGVAPDGHDAWTIEIETVPGGPIGFVHLSEGGVATSSTRRRIWHQDGSDRHHLLDPETAEPTTADVVGATVIAGTARWAEAFTKPAFVRSTGEWFDLLDRHSAAGRAATESGPFPTSSGWSRFALRASAPTS
jgi:thiamine biosynthesis lipoprotein